MINDGDTFIFPKDTCRKDNLKIAKTYKVKHEETLFSISQNYYLNIQVGCSSKENCYYVIKEGDTLFSIVRKYSKKNNVDKAINDLLKLNSIEDSDAIDAGHNI